MVCPLSYWGLVKVNVTVPVTSMGLRRLRCDTSPFAALMVAVNVTKSPYVEGFSLDATVTLVLAEFTICPPLRNDVLGGKVESPEYAAATVCVPTVRLEMLPELATPETNTTGEPKGLP